MSLKASLLFRVSIHGRDDIPPIEDDGINVGPNTATDIALQHVSSKNKVLQKPPN